MQSLRDSKFQDRGRSWIPKPSQIMTYGSYARKGNMCKSKTQCYQSSKLSYLHEILKDQKTHPHQTMNFYIDMERSRLTPLFDLSCTFEFLKELLAKMLLCSGNDKDSDSEQLLSSCTCSIASGVCILLGVQCPPSVLFSCNQQNYRNKMNIHQ